MRMTTAKNLLHKNSPSSTICLRIVFALFVLIPVFKKYDVKNNTAKFHVHFEHGINSDKTEHDELSWRIEYYFHVHLKSHQNGLIKPKRTAMTNSCPYCGKSVMDIYEEATRNEMLTESSIASISFRQHQERDKNEI